MKHKKFTSARTNTYLDNGYFGDEGICIRIVLCDNNDCRTHIFNNEKEVKQLIKQLKKSLKDG